jgi:hypothetical protein
MGDDLTAALNWLAAAERLVNDDPARGPGAPHVPGLCELRTGIGLLRKALEDRMPVATTRERDRLRALLDQVHAQLQDALNATPLDSPDGTGSGFDYELRRRGPGHETECLGRLERMAGRRFVGASVREALDVFEALFWSQVDRPLTAPRGGG